MKHLTGVAWSDAWEEASRALAFAPTARHENLAKALKVAVIGGGPAGLYFSILFKKARPEADIRVFEKNPEGVTWGWGVVFSEETMSNFDDADPETFAAITESFARWDDIDTYFKGEKITSGGHGFAGLRRVKLLEILTARARELGVEVAFDTTVEGLDAFDDCDLVVAADGVNSPIRNAHAAHFEPRIDPGRARFIWLGSDKKWDAFTFIIRENEHGLFQVHAYQFEAGTSTFIVECDEQSWRNAGLDQADEAESIAYCERLFAPELESAKLLGNRSRWISFPTLRCKTWHTDRIVLIGDAAHTAHFSIGSGTKLAMEDAIHLSRALTEHEAVPAALEAYYEGRWLDVAKLQRAADVSRHWFEEIGRYTQFEPEQLVASMMSRSKRVTHDNLRLRDGDYVDRLDRWFATSQGMTLADDEAVPPPMFVPFQVGGLKLANRVVVSPMCMYSAHEGVPNDFHLVHLGSRAMGGAGLVIAEMTNVSAQGRISPGCAGIYNDEQQEAWRRIVDYVHDHTAAKIGLQLGHAGRKASTEVLPKGGHPLTAEQGAWETIAPSAIAYDEGWHTPREMTRADMQETIEAYREATKRALEAGFDLVEVHMAHGYLLSTFISPLTNQRTDDYGGSLENRLRFPLEVLDAVREVWPTSRALSVRISANDWKAGGTTPEDAVEIAKALKAHGCDIVDVSAGGLVPDAEPVYGRMFQTPFSDRIRNEAGIATMAVGNIQGWDHINTILVSGRADLCALARPHLYDPYLTLHAAAEQGREELAQWPAQYRASAAVAQRVADTRRASFDES